jgi:hypothetical protein
MKPPSVQWSPDLDREFIDQVLARYAGRPGGLLAILQHVQNSHAQKYSCLRTFLSRISEVTVVLIKRKPRPA